MDTANCPVCRSAVTEEQTAGILKYSPAPLSPAVLAVALDNEQVTRAVAAIAGPELRLAVAAVFLEGVTARDADAFFTEQDVRDEAEAAVRCDNVAAQLRKQGTRFAEAADFRDLASRHRTRATRILALLPDATQRRIKAKLTQEGPDAPPAIEVVPR
jgi:hypothetical protein